MKIRYLNFLRLIATLSVVFLHASAGILDVREITQDYVFNLTCYKHILQFGVPLFVMISGALFLNLAKEATCELFIHKYVKRIIGALIVFAMPMCAVESFVNKWGKYSLSNG